MAAILKMDAGKKSIYKIIKDGAKLNGVFRPC
jgi:hypothetical protein